MTDRTAKGLTWSGWTLSKIGLALAVLLLWLLVKNC